MSVLICDAVDGPPPVFLRAHAKECGDKRYFTGKPCPQGHVVERTVGNGQCCECGRLRALENYRENPKIGRAKAASFRAANPGKVKELWASYYDRYRDYLCVSARVNYHENRDCRLFTMRMWKLTNKDLVSRYQRAWISANRSHVRARMLAYRSWHKERIAQTGAAWRVANSNLHALYERNRRAKLRNAEGSHTKEDIDRILKAQRYRCAYCRCSIRSEKRRHIDHMTAVVNGGSNMPKNLQAACITCNLRKGKKSPEDFARIMGLLI